MRVVLFYIFILIAGANVNKLSPSVAEHFIQKPLKIIALFSDSILKKKSNIPRIHRILPAPLRWGGEYRGHLLSQFEDNDYWLFFKFKMDSIKNTVDGTVSIQRDIPEGYPIPSIDLTVSLRGKVIKDSLYLVADTVYIDSPGYNDPFGGKVRRTIVRKFRFFTKMMYERGDRPYSFMQGTFIDSAQFDMPVEKWRSDIRPYYGVFLVMQ